MFTIRPATQTDFPAIKALIRTVRINRIGLDWPRFIVAVDSTGKMVGCGQVKQHGDGSRELASIAVTPEWRGKGVARAIIHYLLGLHPRPLYLTCRASLEAFYERFGFHSIAPTEMPPYFSRVYGLLQALRKVRILSDDLRVMIRDS